jgi:MADS-box transcription factor
MGMPPVSHGPVQQVSQQPYITEPGRASIPPAFASEPSSERTVPVIESSQDNAAGGIKTEHSQSPPQPKSLAKSQSRSIFTPIDDRGSVLARQFGFYDSPQGQGNQLLKPEPPQENSHNSKKAAKGTASEPPRPQPIPSAAEIKPPTRTNSGPLTSKRPQLKVQIPSENSDRGSSTGESSSRDSGGNKTATPAKDNPPAGVVLPPPSPSAGAILSAGAQGPPNPFARPPPPGQASYGNSVNNAGNSGGNSNNIETPISALPSRFVSDNLLPSPSSFFPEWGFGRSGPDSNLLPSPLTFPTPAVPSGPSFSREDEQEKKRKSPEGGIPAEGANKKPKT